MLLRIRTGQASKFAPTYWTLQGTTYTYCNSFWYCSKEKALDTVKVDYPNTGTLTYGSNFICMFNPNNSGYSSTITDQFQTLYSKIADVEAPLQKDVDAFWNFIMTAKYTSTGKDVYYYKTYWSPMNSSESNPQEKNFRYYCAVPEYYDSWEKVGEKIVQEFIPEHCDKSAPGNYFGAGGGGGNVANETIGVFGYGGDGAPGAVIIEW